MLTAEEVLKTIGCSLDALESVEKLWDDSMAVYPGAENIPFLQDDAIISDLKATGFGDEMDEHFLRAAAAIRANGNSATRWTRTSYAWATSSATAPTAIRCV